MEAGEWVSQAKFGRDGNDEDEKDLREWDEFEKISQSSDRDAGKVRGDEQDDTVRNAPELCPVSRV